MTPTYTPIYDQMVAERFAAELAAMTDPTPPPPSLRPVNVLVTAAGAAAAGLTLIGGLILATVVIL